MTSTGLRSLVTSAAALLFVSSVSAAPIGRFGDPAPQLQRYEDPNHETTTADVPGLTPATSACQTSNDDTYGTKINPVRIGGGPLYLASREIKYLSALRGPAGQGVHFKRGGSLRDDENTMLDIYQLEYKGFSTTIYIDGYHWDTPLAPKGLLCGAAMNLVAPGPDSFQTARQITTFAINLASKPEDGISIDPDGSATHGLIFDRVRLIALGARELEARGRTLGPDEVPPSERSNRMVVIAFPIQCDGTTIPAEQVTLSDANGNVPQELGKASGRKIGDMVQGYAPPEGAIAAAYGVPALIQGARVSIRYATGCGTQPRDLLLPVRAERARVMKSVSGVIPSDVAVPADGVQVRVQAVVDASGVPREAVYDAGPWALRRAAIAAAEEWRLEPPRMNGAPVFDITTLMIPFKSLTSANTGNSLGVPVLAYGGSEDNGQFTRYVLHVANVAAFADELFMPAPDLPPCGLNTNASRTWVDIYAAGGKRLYGFCGLKSGSALANLSFVVRKGQAAPSAVYVTFTDRRNGVTISSNTVDIR